MCIHKPSPPSLIYCICAPSHVDFGYAFSPATYLGHLLLHVGTSRTPRISYFPYSFAGRRHIWVAFYLMSKVGRHPGPLRSFLWCINADKSTPNMPNSSLKSIIRVSIFLKYSSCCRDREGAGQPVPNQRLREGAAHSSRGQWTASHSFWESLCTCKRTSRCEYTSSFHISYFLFLKFILKQSSRNITFQNQFPNSSISINSHLI